MYVLMYPVNASCKISSGRCAAPCSVLMLVPVFPSPVGVARYRRYVCKILFFFFFFCVLK